MAHEQRCCDHCGDPLGPWTNWTATERDGRTYIVHLCCLLTWTNARQEPPKWRPKKERKGNVLEFPRR